MLKYQQRNAIYTKFSFQRKPFSKVQPDQLKCFLFLRRIFRLFYYAENLHISCLYPWQCDGFQWASGEKTISLKYSIEDQSGKEIHRIENVRDLLYILASRFICYFHPLTLKILQARLTFSGSNMCMWEVGMELPL